MLDKKLGEFLNALKSYNILYQKSLRNDLKIIIGNFQYIKLILNSFIIKTNIFRRIKSGEDVYLRKFK